MAKYNISNISDEETLSFVCGKWSPLVRQYAKNNPKPNQPLSEKLKISINDLKLKDIFLFIFTYLRIELVDMDGIVKFAKKLCHYTLDTIGEEDQRLRQLVEMIGENDNSEYIKLLNYLIEEYEFVSTNMENALQIWEGLENFKVQKTRAFLPFMKKFLSTRDQIKVFYDNYHNIGYFTALVEAEKQAGLKSSGKENPIEEYDKHLSKEIRKQYEDQMKQVVYGFFDVVLKEKEAELISEKSNGE